MGGSALVAQANPDLSDTKERRIKYTGKSGAVYSLGRAIPLRALLDKTTRIYATAWTQRSLHAGYLEACGEDQLSYEYRHGAISYGAFTFSMAKNLRALRRAGRHPSFAQLIDKTNETLKTLRYDQTAQAVGPSAVIKKPIPGKPAPSTKKK